MDELTGSLDQLAGVIPLLHETIADQHGKECLALILGTAHEDIVAVQNLLEPEGNVLRQSRRDRYVRSNHLHTIHQLIVLLQTTDQAPLLTLISLLHLGRESVILLQYLLDR